jgi:predicted dehydrogenase
MSRKKEITRRDALARSAAIGGFSFLPVKVFGRGGAIPPNDKMNVAFIGIGGLYGPKALRELASQNIVAVCDIDWRPGTPGAGGVTPAIDIANKNPQAKKFDDWRVMLQEMDKSIDGVVVCSADHTHAHASITAMKMGKHVFCEKPLAHSVHEIRAMMAAEKKYKVATQHGVQGHASEDLLSMTEWIKDGAIGDVREVHVFEGARPANAQAPDPAAYYEPIKHIHDEIPVPPEVKWDLFVGPSPFRPWNPMYTPLRWRNWVDFGTGLLGDHGSHFLDPVFTALDLGLPETIEADTDPEYGPEQMAHMFPRMATVRYTFAARGKMPAATVTWHANHMPPMPKGWKEGDKFPTGGGMFIGSKGALIYSNIYMGKPKESVPDMIRLFPDELDKSYKRPAKTLPRPESHWLEWVECARTHKPASTNFQQSGLVCQACLLGDIGIMHKGKILRYDTKAGKFTNSETANQMLQRKYRDGWPLPA